MALELTEEQKKAGWQVKQLGELCISIQSGGTPNRKEPSYYSSSVDGIPWAKTQEIRDGKIYDTEEFISYAGLENSSAKIVPDNTILIAMYGATVGRIGLSAKSMATNQAACALLVDEKKASFLYLYYHLFSVRETLIGLANGAAQQNLNLRTIKEFEVALPPLDEQKRIAKILGSVDDKIEANSRLLDSLDELLRLEYIAVQGDSELKISDIASEVKDGVSPSGILSDEVYVGLEHLPRHDVWLREWGRGEEVTSNKARFKKGDILFGKLRPYFHKVVVAPVDGICSTDIIVARPKQGFESLALQALSSDAVVAHAANASNGTRMPRTKWSDLKDLGVRGSTESKSVVSFELVTALVAENRKLAEIRDLLIQKLIG